MNGEWAKSELEKFIRMTELHNASTGNFFTYKNRTSSPSDEVAKQAAIIEKIIDLVIPEWRTTIRGDASNRWTSHREAAIRAREELAREQELRDNLGEDAPELSAARLHPWIWTGASSLWRSSHFREALEGAIRRLNAETQDKLGRRDVSETDLFKQAFSTDVPQVGRARLRRMADDGSKTYASVQRGAMTFAEGIFSGIRNPLSHDCGHDLTEQHALEYLAALSVLARWVDDAAIEQVDKE